MKVGVPGEFHEDRWQRTAEDSERLCSRAHGKRAVPIEFKLSRGEGGFRPLFGTSTLPTDASGASRRGEGGFRPLFGTAILPTGTSEPSRRAKEVSKRKKAVISKQGEEVISEQREEMASKQGEEMASEQRGEEVLPGGDDGFGGKTAR